MGTGDGKMLAPVSLCLLSRILNLYRREGKSARTRIPEHLLHAAGEGGTKILNRIHHHWAIDFRS